ncbi:dicarboxylate/amino acid:cation symporter [Rufibacter glacialis]|uniref:Dicarboxylate/amino acid:cation symporter n=1 Tax=Rufibacter glacialis TaxID=1259555 RepID=A0A5M8Q9E9_9BACT|nr:dicarboxylate/amino acid:cation symporter [Rufibacter glacialis]KAA6431773.1 dicarboxylate/amino acid:cation symporter [Rufibacter glacialis]GGK81683.1 aerobic C4-dicarboxylate transport protein [Rufibacter glacialis]
MIRKKPIYESLYFQVIAAIITGIAVGHFFPDLGVQLKPLGDAFIKLVKMMIGPVVFCTIVTGIAGMQDMKQVGRVGVKALLYFEVLTTVALLLGLLVVNLLQPGVGMHVDAASLDTGALSALTTTKKPEQTGAMAFFLHLIPENIIDALAQGDLLQILFFSVLFGFGLSKIGEKGRPVYTAIQSIATALFAVIHMIMKVAPLGALGAMAYTIGKYGLESLGALGQLMGSFYLTCIVFIVVILGGVMKVMGLSIFKLLRYIREELLIVLGTSSSEAALPSLMEKMEKLGCSKPVVGLVVPTGYSFNLDGTSIYLTMAAVFVAQATDTPLDFSHQVTLLLVLLITSKGAAGVTGSGFITLAATLPAVGNIPVAGLALILGIDRFMSEARALTNLIGNAVATIYVSKWEKEIDLERAKKLIG